MNRLVKNNAVITIFFAFVIFYFLLWYASFGGGNIYGDGSYYYDYFVRLFVTHNIKGSGLIKYPVGTMLLELPFLLVSLFLSKIFGMDLEGGYSICFQRGIFYAALFYYILGTILLYAISKKRYSEKASVLMCACMTFGTMIPVYVCDMSSYSHIYGYFVCAAVFYFVDLYEENRKKKNAVILDFLLGALLGLATIIRNTNVVIGAVYLFYNIESLKMFFDRLKNKIFKPRIIVQFTGFALIYAIQMLFWRIMSGEWIIYSYGDESFRYIKNPQVIKVLFSDAKGLFIYSPILMVAIISMIVFRSQNKEYRVGQWIIFAAVTYLISAWWCWWLGCGYGERMYCDVLCVFALPLAGFFYNLDIWCKENTGADGLGTLQKCISFICYVVIALFILWNLVCINGTRNGVISNNLGTWYDLLTQFKNCFVK